MPIDRPRLNTLSGPGSSDQLGETWGQRCPGEEQSGDAEHRCSVAVDKIRRRRGRSLFGHEWPKRDNAVDGDDICVTKERLTNIVRVEFIDSPDGESRSGSQNPFSGGAHEAEFTWVQVVDQTRVEADVRVDDQRDSKETVEDGLLGRRDGSAVKRDS